ncbi:MAG: hypothetical protein ACPL0G_06570 [Infirmifilum uzonense]
MIVMASVGKRVVSGVLLAFLGVILSISTLLSSTWLSLLPLLLLPFVIAIYFSRLGVINTNILKYGLAGAVIIALFFLLAAIPPLYISWITLLVYLFLLSLKHPKLLIAYLVFLFLFIPLMLYSKGYLTVTSHNLVKIGDLKELQSHLSRPSSLVVVGHAMADIIAHTQLSPNEKISEWEEIIVNGTPYWVFAVTPQNTIAQNYVSKIILVHVQTGEVKSVPVHMTVGSGLWLLNDIVLRTFLATAQPIGNTYPFIHDGKAYFAACVNRLGGLGLVELPDSVYVYNEDGGFKVIPQFSGDTHLPEDYDWEYFNWYIEKWLYHLADENPVTFSFFPRGFLWIPASPYSQDLLNMTLLIPGSRGETVRVYFGVSPQNPNSIVSLILVNNTGAYYYNVKSIGIYSPYYIQSLVQGKLPAISGGYLYAKYSQLIYLDGYYWIVPIYAQTNIVTLWGIAIVNATNPQSMKIYQYHPDYGTFQDFLHTVLALRLTEQPLKQPCRLVTGTVSHVAQFVYKGDTYIAIEVQGKTFFATPEIGLTQFVKLLKVGEGSKVTICVSDDKIINLLEP